VAFHSSAALCTIALLLVWWRDRSALNNVITHPFVLLPAALATWSAMTAPLADYPLLSLMGSPQLGEGALWYVNLAVLVACALLVIREKVQWRFLIIWSALIVCGAICVRLLASAQGTYELIWIGAYLAYIGITLPFICLRHLSGHWRWFWLLVMGASISILIIAESKVALVLFAFGAGIVGFGYLFNERTIIGGLYRSRSLAITVVGLVAVLPLIIIGSGILNEFPSLLSRHLVFKLMGEAQGIDWQSLLVGQGWGRTQDALISNVNVAGENLWKPRWDYFRGDYLHSHSWILEVLYACGLPGVVIALLFFLSIPAYCDSDKRVFAVAFASGYAGLNALWFQVSFSIPFVALALAALGSSHQINQKQLGKTFIVNRIFPAVLVIIVFSQFIAASSLYTFGVKVSKAIALYQNPKYINTQIHFPIDFRGAEHGFALTIRDHLVWLRKRLPASEKPMAKNQVMVIRSIIYDLENRIPRSHSPYLILAGVAVFSDLVFDPKFKEIQFELRENEKVLWGQWVKKLITLAPGRTDTAIPYFSWLLSQNKLAILTDFTQSILVKNPNDPVGLFFKGAALMRSSQEGAQVRGLKYLKKGLEKGVERFMPVDPELKKKILKTK